MKLVKKILRLLPCFFIIGAILSCILYSINLPLESSVNPISYFEPEFGFWDQFNDSLYIIVADTPFQNLFDWVSQNLTQSYFIYWSFFILIYELYLSLCFLLFDFINMIFGWVNKLINKGGNLDE